MTFDSASRTRRRRRISMAGPLASSAHPPHAEPTRSRRAAPLAGGKRYPPPGRVYGYAKRQARAVSAAGPAESHVGRIDVFNGRAEVQVPVPPKIGKEDVELVAVQEQDDEGTPSVKAAAEWPRSHHVHEEVRGDVLDGTGPLAPTERPVLVHHDVMPIVRESPCWQSGR